MAAKQLSDLRSDGTTLGQSTADKVAFHGSTPVVQQTITTLATGATIATVVARVQQLQTLLRTIGLGSS